MTPPLSVLLPVHNAQATLAADVATLLDVLPELAAWFELIVIDDGSTDATCEIAEELVTEYPQVRLVRHTVRRGVEGSWRVGLERTDAPIVLGHNGQAGIEPAAVVALLKQKPVSQANRLTVSQPAESDSRLMRWLAARALAGEPPTIGGFCVLRREAELPPVRLPHRWRIEPAHEVRSSPPAEEARPAAKPQPVPVPRMAPPRPSFLKRLQNLALGE